LEIQLAEAVTNSRIARDKNLIGMRYPQGELWYRENLRANQSTGLSSLNIYPAPYGEIAWMENTIQS